VLIRVGGENAAQLLQSDDEDVTIEKTLAFTLWIASVRSRAEVLQFHPLAS
jgi:hypothetical protein